VGIAKFEALRAMAKNDKKYNVNDLEGLQGSPYAPAPVQGNGIMILRCRR
jgi:hypothetical protein